MKSTLFNEDAPFTVPPECGPCRREATFAIYKDGRIYRFMLTDKIAVEDPYLVIVQATAFAIQQGEPYAGQTPPRAIRDFLIKSSVVI